MSAHRCDHLRRRVANASVASRDHDHAIAQVHGRVGESGAHCDAGVVQCAENKECDANGSFANIVKFLTLQ